MGNTLKETHHIIFLVLASASTAPFEIFWSFWSFTLIYVIYACNDPRKIPLLNLTSQNVPPVTLTPKDLSAALDEILHATSNRWCHIFRNAIPRVKRWRWNSLGETRKDQNSQRARISSMPNISLKLYPFILWYCWSPRCIVFKPTTQLLGKILGSQEQRQEICQALQDLLFTKTIARTNRSLQLRTGLAQFAFQVNLPPERVSI